MPVLSAAQIAGYARQGGFAGNDIATATAIALAESSGRTDARGDIALQTQSWGPSIGLWQIRSMKSDRGTGRTRDEIANLDPAVNARHAYEIYRSQGWKAWTVYTTGAYLLHMPAARAAAANPGTAAETIAGSAMDLPSPTGIIGDAASGALGILEVLQNVGVYAIKTGEWLRNPDNIMRAVKVGVGVGLVLAGLRIAAEPVVQRVADPAAKLAGTVLTGGTTKAATAAAKAR